MTKDLKRQEQWCYENRCRDEARTKYEKNIRKEIERCYYSTTASGRLIVNSFIKSFAVALEADLIPRLSQGPGRNVRQQSSRDMDKLIDILGATLGDKDLKDLRKVFKDAGVTKTDDEIKRDHGLYAVSMITLKTIVDCYSRKGHSNLSVVEVADKIGGRLEDELRLLAAYEQAPEWLKRVGKKKARDPFSTPTQRRYSPVKTIKSLMRQNGLEFDDAYFGKGVGPMLGLYVLDLAKDRRIIDTRNKIESGKKNHQKMIYNITFIQELKKWDDHYKSRVFNDEPLLCIPDDWEKTEAVDRFNTTGGYLHDFAKHGNAMCRSYFSDTSFSTYGYELLNRLQHTAWAVDTAVFEVAEKLFEDRNQTSSIGSFHPIPDPVVDLVPEEGISDEEKARRKAEKEKEHYRHIIKERQAVRTNAVMRVAKKFQNKGEFYYPWGADWRGRAYISCSWLQIQGTDFERSLIRFREGCELNYKAKQWAARAVGAAFLGTGDSYDVREQWTYDNEELIRKVANDTIGYIHEWENCKEPWSFVQLAKEWTSVVLDETKDLWFVPIGVDSTASGLQLLSAIRRDPVGMRYANLLPSTDADAPLDAYRRVLAVAKELVERDGKQELLPFLEDRKPGKISVMLSVYGGSFPTIRNKIEEHFKEKETEITKEQVNAVTGYVINASKEVFPEAYKALAWLRKAARQRLKTQDRITWTTPLGDVIDLTKNKLAVMTVHTECMGRVNVCLGEEKDSPDINGMVDSFAPSWVHALDSSVLKAAFHDWKRPLGTIHDCIRVLPADMTAAVCKIKEGFKRVCDGNPLEQLVNDLEIDLQVPDQIEPNLLQAVDRSKYLFN